MENEIEKLFGIIAINALIITGTKNTIAAAKNLFVTFFNPFFASGFTTILVNSTVAKTINNIGTINCTKSSIKMQVFFIFYISAQKTGFLPLNSV